MPQTTIKQLAETTGSTVDELLKQVLEAGLPKKEPDDVLTEEEKKQLAYFIQSRKTKSTLSVARGKSREVRRKRHKQVKTTRRQGQTAGTVSVEVRGRKAPAMPGSTLKKKATPTAPEPPPTPTKKLVKPKKKTSSELAAKSASSVSDKAVQNTLKEATRLSEAGKKPVERRQLRINNAKRGKRKTKERVLSPPKQVNVGGAQKHGFEKPTEPVKRDVMVPEKITVANLAQRMAIKSGELVKILMGMNMLVTINQVLDQDTAILVVEELGHIAKPEKKDDTEKELVKTIEMEPGVLKLRPPVVVVMGHVDHGKTSLLDYIRSTRVTADEAGGITQHTGAYHVETDHGMITFLDTPGHEAFTSMRARGTSLTDIVVLVIAADDGVMPQTVEAIEHAKAAAVPIIVALNKIDKEGSDIEKVKGDLAKHGLIPEDWGGNNMMIGISAKTGENIDNLLEAISLQAEVMELKASEEGAAVATVVESSRDKGRGTMVMVLVHRGTLNKGDILLAGAEYGKVRAMIDEHGNSVQHVGPSIPAVVFGLSGTPDVGEEAVVVNGERKARDIADQRREKQRAIRLSAASSHGEELFSVSAQDRKELRILIRADVRGTAEALRDSLEKIASDEVKVNILSNLVGGITVSDINLAAASQAMVIGFNARADAPARKAAEAQGVTIRYYGIIYELIDDIKKTMSDMLSPEIKEEIVGLATVKDIFRSSRFGTVAGCQVVEGMVKRGNPIRVLRDQLVIFEGELESLRRHKDDAAEVNAGTECGIAVKDYNDVKVGDQIEVYERIETPRNL